MGDYPDYTLTADIIAQTIAEIIQRPKYGVLGGYSGAVVVTANATTTLISVAGKGMVYGGIIYLDHTASQKDSGATILVDGASGGSASFDTLRKFGIITENTFIFYLTAFDEVNFVYCEGISSGFTFESSVSLGYVESHGDTPTVYYVLILATI